MLDNRDYVRHSLELNLFFLRIAKEHAIFAAASLPPRDMLIIQQLIDTKNNFEALLNNTASLADGVISPEALSSGELFTELTLPAEVQTQFLTGIPINTNITKKEMALKPASARADIPDLSTEVSKINRKAMKLIKEAIAFKEMLLGNVLTCKAFSWVYPTMLEHVIEESRFYLKLLQKLENRDPIDSIQEVIEQEMTWNEVMFEHSTFIRGYLDPSEGVLINTANTFANELGKLLQATNTLPAHPERVPQITKQSQEIVTRLRMFKRQSTEGILSCKIKSVINPLLSDHVTREANHYLRLLRTFGAIIK
jgi:rubrerythrin